MAQVLAWHNDPQLKADAVRRMQEHRKADEFIQGHYFFPDISRPSGFRGCALGCLIESIETRDRYPSWHWAAEMEFGINNLVARKIDDIFESLEFEDAADFAVEVLEVIPVGADLSHCMEQWSLVTEKDPMQAARSLIELLKNAPVPT